MTRFAIILLLYCTITSVAAQPPNVVFINVDDLGYRDLGFMGSTYYETPNIDKLAAAGMLFTQAYAGAANCAPSRACLLSGMNTPRHGIYTVANSDRGDTRTRRIVPIPNQTILADSIVTLAELFQSQGYTAGTFGKWHLGEDPTTQGFDINVGGSQRGNPGRDGYFSPYVVDNLPDGPDGEYLTDRLTSEAIKFLRANRSKPFFLYLPYYTVHTPLIGKESLVEKYRQKEPSFGQDNPVYAAMIASLDENIGKLLSEVEELQLSENTIVIFTSDNGGIRDVSYQDPLRAGKGSYYEGGIRVPLIIRWPQKIAPNTRCTTAVSNLDFYPTFHSILNLPVTQQRPPDGVDLSPLFAQDTVEERPLFWHFPVYLQAYNPKQDDGRDPLFRTRPGSVVRQGKWKLHHYYEDDSLELYNLADDPGERNNVVNTFPQKTQELHRLLRQWLEETQADIPRQLNPDYDAAYEQTKVSEVLQ